VPENLAKSLGMSQDFFTFAARFELRQTNRQKQSVRYVEQSHKVEISGRVPNG
jgi:hypothetical protein